MIRLLALIAVAGMAYAGLHFYYDLTVKRAMAERFDSYGLSGVQIESVGYSPFAPLSTQATVFAEILYRGVEASVEIRVDGHPLFSDEVHLELEGLQGLRLMIGQ